MQKTESKKAIKRTKKNVITEQSFHNIKMIADALYCQLKFDKQVHRVASREIDFDESHNVMSQFIKQTSHGSIKTIVVAICKNDDLMSALNLDVVFSGNSAYVHHRWDDGSIIHSIPVKALFHNLCKLIHSGRQGIWAKVHHNNQARQKIEAILHQMNTLSK